MKMYYIIRELGSCKFLRYRGGISGASRPSGHGVCGIAAVGAARAILSLSLIGLANLFPATKRYGTQVDRIWCWWVPMWSGLFHLHYKKASSIWPSD